MGSAWTNLAGGLSEVLSLSHNGEGSPTVGVGVFLTDLLGGFGGGGGFVFARLESPVERSHKFVGAGIVDIPEGQEQGARAGVECSANQAEEFVAGGDDVEAGGAAAEGKKLSVQAHLVELVKVQVSVTEGDAREHRVVGAEAAVSCHVEDAAVDSLFDQFFVSGGSAQVELGVGKDSMDGVDLVENQGRFFVGDAEDRRAGGGSFVGSVTEREDGCAGGVGNVVEIEQEFVASVESVERQVMQVAVRDDNQVFCVDELCNRVE